MRHFLLSLTCAAVLLAPAASVWSLEATAGNKDVSQDTSALNMKLDSSVSILKDTLNKMLACNRQDMVFAPGAADADPVTGCRKLSSAPPFDPTKLEMTTAAGSTKYNGYAARSDDPTARQICYESGFSGVSGYSGKQYSSPGNNKIITYLNGVWTVQGAKAGSHLSSLTCYKFGLRQ